MWTRGGGGQTIRNFCGRPKWKPPCLAAVSGPYSGRGRGRPKEEEHLAAIVRVRVVLIMLSAAAARSFGEFAPRTRPGRLENETHSVREGEEAGGGGGGGGHHHKKTSDKTRLPTIWRLEFPFWAVYSPAMNAIRNRNPKTPLISSLLPFRPIRHLCSRARE